MSNFIYITEKGKQKQLDHYHHDKSLFDLVEFQSIGRWKLKTKSQDKQDINYLLFKIQDYCVKNNCDKYLTSQKVGCLITYILLYDADEKDYQPVFDDLIVKPYGFFYNTAEQILRRHEYFDNNGIIKIIEEPKNSPQKELIDLKFKKVNKVVFKLTSFDLIESMHKDSSFMNYYNQCKKNGFYHYDIPKPLQKYFRVNKYLKSNF